LFVWSRQFSSKANMAQERAAFYICGTVYRCDGGLSGRGTPSPASAGGRPRRRCLSDTSLIRRRT
jgi:hypothetical protein